MTTPTGASPTSARFGKKDEVPHLGATLCRDGTTFAVWSTLASRVAVRLYDAAKALCDEVPLRAAGHGLFTATVAGVEAGALYNFVLDGTELPDPYARDLPYGVHGPARVARAARTEPLRPGVAPERVVLYELHVGTFTREGTYAATAAKLPHLAALGVTMIELMPLSSFAGRRGWGYDGVAHYAPYAGYGEPGELRALMDAAHSLGIGVILDVVYNHFGPAGNYLASYAPEYFTSKHRTAWGDAPNFANPFLRSYVLENARYWLVDFGFDGLRLDATHGIRDTATPHILQELAALAHALDPPRLLFAEDERNDPSLVTAAKLDGVWADDFHHCVHVTLTGEQDGYYAAYRPGVTELARTIERGWLYEGQSNPLTKSPRGAAADALEARTFVYCIQNHDQIGNRALGTRLNRDVSLDAYAAASMLLLFLPMTPLLFMGQEWAATAPFLYFTDHHAELGRQITSGRREEFQAFASFRCADPHVEVPDPQADETFQRSKLNWQECQADDHAAMLRLYQTMLQLRREDVVLASSARPAVGPPEHALLRIRRSHAGEARVLVINFSKSVAHVSQVEGQRCLLASRPGAWSPEALAPMSAVLLADPPSLSGARATS